MHINVFLQLFILFEFSSNFIQKHFIALSDFIEVIIMTCVWVSQQLPQYRNSPKTTYKVVNCFDWKMKNLEILHFHHVMLRWSRPTFITSTWNFLEIGKFPNKQILRGYVFKLELLLLNSFLFTFRAIYTLNRLKLARFNMIDQAYVEERIFIIVLRSHH